jgi:hypothetical protein
LSKKADLYFGMFSLKQSLANLKYSWRSFMGSCYFYLRLKPIMFEVSSVRGTSKSFFRVSYETDLVILGD